MGRAEENIREYYISMDVMFDSDGIVVTSLAVTYLTLKSGSKVHQGHFKLIWDIGKMQKMYRFGIDVMFGSGNYAVTSKVKVKVTMPRSKGQNNSVRYKYWAW